MKNLSLSILNNNREIDSHAMNINLHEFTRNIMRKALFCMGKSLPVYSKIGKLFYLNWKWNKIYQKHRRHFTLYSMAQRLLYFYDARLPSVASFRHGVYSTSQLPFFAPFICPSFTWKIYVKIISANVLENFLHSFISHTSNFYGDELRDADDAGEDKVYHRLP